MPIVSEDVPDNPGSANASIEFGQGSQIKAAQREIASRSGAGGQPQQTAPAPPPAAAAQPAAQAQPEPQGRLDMNQVFPPMPEMQPEFPWRQAIRAAAYHPLAGPALARLSEQIQNQRGPHG